MLKYEDIVHNHSRNIFAIAMLMVNDESMAKDITQDVFIRIYRGLRTFRGKSELGTWIYRITMNVCFDHFKKMKRLPDEFSEKIEQIHSMDNDPETVYEREWLNETVKVALIKLPSDQRMALSLFYYYSRSYEEIGSAMEIPIGTVKSHIHRGKEKLRKMLEPLLETKK